MQTEIKSAEMVQPISLSDLPDGEFEGLWSGYEIIINLEDSQIRFRVADGIRGINIPCVVIIENGLVSAKTLR